jgi:hypothetical protein
MDSDTKKLLNWQRRVLETMYENAGGGEPFAYIWQTKWDKLKQEAEEMQKKLQRRQWTVCVVECYDGLLCVTTEPGSRTVLARVTVTEGEGLDNVST